MYLCKGFFLVSPATADAAQPESESVAQLAVTEGPQGFFFFQFLCRTIALFLNDDDFERILIHGLGSCISSNYIFFLSH